MRRTFVAVGILLLGVALAVAQQKTSTMKVGAFLRLKTPGITPWRPKTRRLST